MLNGFSPLHTGLYSREAYTILKMGLLLKSYYKTKDQLGDSGFICKPDTDEHGRFMLKFTTDPRLTEYQSYYQSYNGNGRTDFVKRNPDGELIVMSKARRWEELLLEEFRRLLRQTIKDHGLREDTLFWPSNNLVFDCSSGNEPPLLEAYTNTMKNMLGQLVFVRDDYYGNYIYEDISYEKLKPISYQMVNTVVELFLQKRSDGEPESDQFLIEQRVLCYETAKKFFDDLYVFIRATSGKGFMDILDGRCKLKTGTYKFYTEVIRDLLCEETASAEDLYTGLWRAGVEADSLGRLMDIKKFKEGLSAYRMKMEYSAVPNIIQLGQLADTFL